LLGGAIFYYKYERITANRDAQDDDVA